MMIKKPRQIVSENIEEGLKALQADLKRGMLFQVDMDMNGVIMSAHRFGADAKVTVDYMSCSSMSVYIDSYNVRLWSPSRISWWETEGDHRYSVNVWLTGGLNVWFWFWC